MDHLQIYLFENPFNLDISLIIPVYNAAPFIRDAVRSALEQPEVKEVLLIEDGSNDHSLSYCADLATRHACVQLYQHPDKKNHGAGASRNLGIQNATQEYIAFLDADDYYLPQRFQQAKKIFCQQHDADGVYEATERIFDKDIDEKNYNTFYDDRKLLTIENVVKPKDLFEFFFIGKYGWFHLNGLVIKRKLIERVKKFDESLRQTQDTDFILRLCLAGKLYPGSLTVPVSVARIHGANRILDERKVRYYRRLLFEKWFARMLKSNWSSELNIHITKGLLYNHPRIRKYEDRIVYRYLFKVGILAQLSFKHPVLVRKLFL